PSGLTASAVSCNQVNLSWTASTDSGGSGLKGYAIYRNGAPLTQVPAPTITYSDTGTAAATSYSYTVLSIDNAGNQSALSTGASATTPACPDTISPNATLTSPINGSTLSGNITLGATASDNVNVTKVEFYCDGTVLLGSGTAAPYTVACDTTT